MKLKSLILMMLIVAIGGAAYFYSANQSTVSIDAPLVPGLDSSLNKIKNFSVKKAGNVLLSSVSKTEAGWVVDNRAGYPANVKSVRAVFKTLSEAKLSEAKTSNPDNYSKLGVEDTESQDAKGVLVSIDGLDDPVNIIFGNDGSSGKNTQYIRKQGVEQSWLMNKKINFRRNTTGWLQKDLFDIPPERIKTIQIIHPDGTTINIANTGNAAYEFELDANAPEGKKISESEIYQVANALSSLQLKDVVPSDEVKSENANSIRCVFKTFDGLTITTNSMPSSEVTNVEPHFNINIQFNAQDVDEDVKDVVEDGKTVIDASTMSDPKAAEELANSMQSKLSGWSYVLPTITKDALTKKLEHFFINKGV